ncbi:ribosomal rna small subunit methyltransferase h [Desulfoluna butyratoxydans]|uniref:Ribosomal RNA small subunit methyltransferase H n=2 Tax=Desulfoluna butyratoxydans TaxID=231438 RepID=A0A4U8YGA8_9BACT|nr:ribosomal rna small subunit methyltransferase h [Desulfoluna butyratoxydans]
MTALDPKQGGTFVDGTLGGGGHSALIIDRIMPGGRFIGIDQDMDAIQNARKRFSDHGESVTLVHDNFANIAAILKDLGVSGVDGILVDIGLSQHQLEGSGRGFSFMRDEPLDMRMDARGDTTAEDLVNTLPEKELADIIFKYGEERFSRGIARAIVKKRQASPITTTAELADIIRYAMPAKAVAKQKIHPATRSFQAIRIAVNRELDRLERFMDDFLGLLNPGGRLCVLSFHSLEDRIVKQKMKELATGCTCPKQFPICTCGNEPKVKLLTRKAVRPADDEVAENPMARSTRLRACEKL